MNASNTKQLKDLLDKIQEIKRIKIGSISLLAGYKRENYLSERISVNEVSDKVIKSVRNLYEKALVNPAILVDITEGDNNARATIENTPGVSLEYLVRILSKVNVLFSNEAEKTAKETGAKATDVLREMNKAARDEADSLFEELRKK